MSDDGLVARSLDLQDILRLCGGQTPTAVGATVAFERELVRALDFDVGDCDMVEAMLDEVHCLAYPDTTTLRPGYASSLPDLRWRIETRRKLGLC